MQTLSPEAASQEKWFAVVVGAGVAGSSLALALAREGRKVLLIDKAAFPRAKTCGGTLNPRAVASLKRLGLGEMLSSLHPNNISGVEWRHHRDSPARMDFDSDGQAYAVSRQTLDTALVREAIHHGAHFLPEWRCLSSCVSDDERISRVRNARKDEFEVHSEVVLACDGLGSMLAAEANLSKPARVGQSCYIGTSTVTAPLEWNDVPTDRILMTVGEEGYAGIVRVEDGRWNIAAALQLKAVKRSSKPADVVRSILAEAGVYIPQHVLDGPWTVTKPGLNREIETPGGERFLLVGDAAGYAEPITGEGMAWALASAEAAVSLLLAGWQKDTASRWDKEWRRVVRDRRWMVTLAGKAARSALATRAALGGIRLFPRIGRWAGKKLAREIPLRSVSS